MRAVRVRALLEVFPISIPALRGPEQDEARGSRVSGRQSSGSPWQQAPYVTVRGLRLPDTLNPVIENEIEAQVGCMHMILTAARTAACFGVLLCWAQGQPQVAMRVRALLPAATFSQRCVASQVSLPKYAWLLPQCQI